MKSEMSEKEYEQLTETFTRERTVDWETFEKEVKGTISTFEQLRTGPFAACGGNSAANLRRKLYALKKEGKAMVRYQTKGKKMISVWKFGQ